MCHSTTAEIVVLIFLQVVTLTNFQLQYRNEFFLTSGRKKNPYGSQTSHSKSHFPMTGLAKHGRIFDFHQASPLMVGFFIFTMLAEPIMVKNCDLEWALSN